jgi:anthranilate phosphoribosyltransferase
MAFVSAAFAAEEGEHVNRAKAAAVRKQLLMRGIVNRVAREIKPAGSAANGLAGRYQNRADTQTEIIIDLVDRQ